MFKGLEKAVFIQLSKQMADYNLVEPMYSLRIDDIIVRNRHYSASA